MKLKKRNIEGIMIVLKCIRLLKLDIMHQTHLDSIIIKTEIVEIEEIHRVVVDRKVAVIAEKVALMEAEMSLMGAEATGMMRVTSNIRLELI